MQIKDCMKRKVYTVTPTTSLREAATLLVKHHIGTLPVVDGQGHLVGLLLIRNVLKLVMPDFIHLMENFDFVSDFGVIESRSLTPENLDLPVSKVMQPPLSVENTCGLLRATAMLNRQNMSDLPVVDSEHCLVGIASQVDIGVALLQHWGVTGS